MRRLCVLLAGLCALVALGGCWLLFPSDSSLLPPTDLVVVPNDETTEGIEYLVSWTDNSQGEIGFRVERRLWDSENEIETLSHYPSEFELVTITAPEATTTTDVAPEGTVPEYRVAAVGGHSQLSDWSPSQTPEDIDVELVLTSDMYEAGLVGLFGEPSSYASLSGSRRLDAYLALESALAVYDTNAELLSEYALAPGELREGLENAKNASSIGDPATLLYIEDFMTDANDLVQQGQAVEALGPVLYDAGEAALVLAEDRKSCSNCAEMPRLDQTSKAIQDALAKLLAGIADISGMETLDVHVFIAQVMARNPGSDPEDLYEAFYEFLQIVSSIRTRSAKLINAINQVGASMTKDDVPNLETALEEFEKVAAEIGDAIDVVNELGELAGHEEDVIGEDVVDGIETVTDVLTDMFDAVVDELDDGDLRKVEALANGRGLHILVNDDVTIPLYSVSLLLASVSLDLEINPDPNGSYGRDVTITVEEVAGETVIEVKPFDAAKALQEYGVIIDTPWLTSKYPDFAPQKITIRRGEVVLEGMNVDDDKLQRVTIKSDGTVTKVDL